MAVLWPRLRAHVKSACLARKDHGRGALRVITWQSLVARVGFAEAPAGSPGVNDDQAIRTANAI